MKIVAKTVGKVPQVIEIDNDLNRLQEVVGGYIEVVPTPFDNKVLLVCDEEGKLKDKKPNFLMNDDLICGDVFFTTSEGEDFTDLNEDQIKKIKQFLIMQEV